MYATSDTREKQPFGSHAFTEVKEIRLYPARAFFAAPVRGNDSTLWRNYACLPVGAIYIRWAPALYIYGLGTSFTNNSALIGGMEVLHV